MKKRILKVVLLLSLFCLLPTKSLADETESKIKQVGFSYKINHPTNQIGSGGALNLKMNPGQEQIATATIRNTSNQDITVLLSLNGARTNSNGGLEYGPNDFKADKSMAYDITDLIEVPKEIQIAKNSEKDIEMTIKMPKVPYEGIVTGGLQMIEKDEGKEEVTSTTIINKVAYLFGITLQMDETELKPQIDLQKVYPEQANFRNAVFLDFANVVAMKVNGLMLDIEITNEGKEDVLFESKKNNMEMAPNTVMSYPVSFGGEKMLAGKYTAHVLASAHGEEWKWDSDFTITKEQADKFNQQDVNLVQERGLDWKLIAVIVSALVFVIAGIYFVRKSLNKKKTSKRNTKNSSKSSSKSRKKTR
ncbi:DUF916 and DUF3324 domain-containing protein [Vagococcus salmoninarum]|uniref:Uncharacterized protein n=1 Tax=Vagococcus salmoninarum TaxID=2739 RepID=A0A429ZNC7_9ENTE|nr:DUF916 and DUF3324 domain-containing protein [Vagococcus salmoninarum]MBE9390443.1 DUF916 and DUF3324 domain-containing protein [Vagococcus salmoninarum]RST95191.1 hypothetical protein CBF35_08380 [Vagococcus salmoninarum]